MQHVLSPDYRTICFLLRRVANQRHKKKPLRNEVDVLQNKLFANKMVLAKISTNQNQFAKKW